MSIRFEDALKAKKLRDYFYKHGRIYIVVDATANDVSIPNFLQGDPALRLVLNTRMPQPIYIRDSFVESNFTFSGVAHHCSIPMHRIWAAFEPDKPMELGLMWEESMPETVKLVMDAVDEAVVSEVREASKEVPELYGEKEDDPTQGAGQGLKENLKESSKQGLKQEGKPELQGRKVGHLRVIK